MQDANTNDNCNIFPIFSFHEQSTSARYIQIPRLDTIKWWKVRHAWVGRVIIFLRNQSRRFIFDCPIKSSEIERSIAFDWLVCKSAICSLQVCNLQSASLQFCSLQVCNSAVCSLQVCKSASLQSASLQSASLQSAVCSLQSASLQVCSLQVYSLHVSHTAIVIPVLTIVSSPDVTTANIWRVRNQ